MTVQSVTLQRFRCFHQYSLQIESPLIFIEGDNGAGKSSFLESLYYACYLRPLTTRITSELVSHDSSYFFIKVAYASAEQHLLEVGFSQSKRIVKHDGVAVSSSQSYPNTFKVVTLSANDLELVTGLPSLRRSFLDSSIIFTNPHEALVMNQFRKVLEQRNHLLFNARSVQVSHDHYLLWTEQLWHKTQALQEKRVAVLRAIEAHLQILVDEFYEGRFRVNLAYMAKLECQEKNYGLFMTHELHTLKAQELRMGRSLFGAHLDDFHVTIQERDTKKFASRGQQKMVVLLLKVAQILYLMGQGNAPIFLLDDFFTDFDQKQGERALRMLLSLGCQLFFTYPRGIKASEWIPQGTHYQQVLMTH